ncbi:Endonuclease/Exonuclease/phosphatase family protein [Rubripirellula tenax]|uniref:Endonuclease/Exonuclease/phosphatase family protein n=1 Tax=Rubripirellula tenax TaxID=2528015 RepID=A0A5C6FBG3_9BACT|nr:endonuclease/exonuclease/phosphatase family protein [Rubripirellula tenax]TWU58795.1 Endonuclease/Exonuclease/phosphatase family protein [Rubripirellula tenax]
MNGQATESVDLPPVTVAPARRPWRRRLGCAAAIVLVVILGPYLFSRLAAPSRRLQTFAHGTPDGQIMRPADKDGVLRIVAFNLAHGRGATDDNWREPGEDKFGRIGEIAELIRQLNADVVVLNEVDFDASWSGRQNQAEAIADRAGFAYRVEERNLDFAFLIGSWRFGNAILSKYPISDAAVVDLPDYAGWESWLAGCKRGVVCEISVPGEKAVRVMGVHLSHRSESLRTDSARMILDQFVPDGAPIIIAGDFNSTPNGFPGSDQTTDNAMDAFIGSNQFSLRPVQPPTREEMTFSTMNPYQVIDWILVPKELTIAAYRVVDTTLSDHRLVVCDITVDQNDWRTE